MSSPRSQIHSVAVIGAGVAGLACAKALGDRGVAVTVFDTGRGVGGRLATRRVGEATFDLGAQYFTVRDERFARASRGSCAVWEGRIGALDAAGHASLVAPVERWVGTPDMSALGRQLAAGLDVRRGHRVDRIERVPGGFRLHGTVAATGVTLAPPPPPPPGTATSAALGTYDRVVVSVPAPQAVPLVGDVSPTLAALAAAVAFEPCFAVGLVAAALRAVPFDGVFIGREGASPSTILSWIARDSSKPGRAVGERWVLHATAAWSEARARDAEPDVISAMTAELARLFALAPVQPSVTVVRRWALARASSPIELGALVDNDVALGGDWACGGRVEGAFVSGLHLAAHLA